MPLKIPELREPVLIASPFYPNPTSAYLGKLIVVVSSFLLGAFYCHWVVDHGTLWTSAASPAAVQASLTYYSALWHAPTWYVSTLSALGIAAATACFVKVVMNGPGGMMFDGGSLVLLISAASVYLANVSAALEYLPLEKLPSFPLVSLSDVSANVTEALQAIAASHVIIAVSLTGVLALQGAQGWSDKPTHVFLGAETPVDARSPRPSTPVVPQG